MTTYTSLRPSGHRHRSGSGLALWSCAGGRPVCEGLLEGGSQPSAFCRCAVVYAVCACGRKRKMASNGIPLVRPTNIIISIIIWANIRLVCLVKVMEGTAGSLLVYAGFRSSSLSSFRRRTTSAVALLVACLMRQSRHSRTITSAANDPNLFLMACLEGGFLPQLFRQLLGPNTPFPGTIGNAFSTVATLTAISKATSWE